jgi:carbon storage regulator
MLVLSRKKNETIVVGDGSIQIVVVEICGNRVRLGIEATESIPIYRGEIWHEIQREADGSDDDDLVEQVRESID